MKLHPAIFATFVVLAASAAGTGDHDWELSWPDGSHECVRTPPRGTARDLCVEAEGAIRDGRLKTSRGLPLGCRPAPGCIPEGEDCIKGFNCK